MLDPEEAAAVARRFGVAGEQVRRDHLISHLLSAFSRIAEDQVVLFGGTALARTHVVDGRLSEDIDLLAIGDRKPIAAALSRTLPTALLREHGRLSWDRPLDAVRDVEPAMLSTDDGLAVRVQLLAATGYPRWPTERRQLHQRYRDAPPAELFVPTLDAFVGMKVAAWIDRAAPRDLYDLWLLNRAGAITTSAAQTFAEHGQTGASPQGWMFNTAPTPAQWRSQLAGQTRLAVDAVTALAAVRAAWNAVDD